MNTNPTKCILQHNHQFRWYVTNLQAKEVASQVAAADRTAAAVAVREAAVVAREQALAEQVRLLQYIMVT
jgi:hypothetical protein